LLQVRSYLATKVLDRSSLCGLVTSHCSKKLRNAD
jgi:hypothetical protein